MTVFWRTFVAFWLAAAILLAILFYANEPWQRHNDQDPVPGSAISALALSHALSVFEQAGANALLRELEKTPGMERCIFLFGSDGRLLVAPTGIPASPWRTLASEVATSAAPQVARVGIRIAFAAPTKSPSGQSYVVVMTAVRPLRQRLERPRFWTKLALAMLPATLICLGLASYITRPLSNLRQTARKLADGDLTARPPDAQTRRRDEIGELSRDIDLMARRIEDLLSAQRRFVADVAHELGAPLTRMQLAISLIQRELRPGRSEGLQRIEREADRLSTLVQELLFLASLEKGAIPSETFEPVPLHSLCQEIVQDNTAEAEEKNCTVSTVFEAVTIRAARQTLRRAIENVFRNAIRHAPRESRVRFACSASRSPDSVLIEVSDSGPGVPQQMLASIFQPFVRAESRQGGPDGTGLGLAIASEAVSLHGGSIWAENLREGGLGVNIRLPRRLETAPPAAKP